jgi:transcriptional regulator with XRE-family HTH domain
MTDREDQEVGEQIRRLRLMRGWTQADLAERAELTVEGVSRIERGARAARVGTLRMIARAMEVPVASLVEPSSGRDGPGILGLAPDLLAVIEPLLDQPPGVRARAARVVRALIE